MWKDQSDMSAKCMLLRFQQSHAGAIVSAYGESAVEKVEILKEYGITISKNPSVMGETVKSVLSKS